MSDLQLYFREYLACASPSCDLHTVHHLLERLVVSLVDRAAVQTHHAREPLHVIDRGRCGHLRAETVTADRRQRQLVLIHKTHYVC